MNWDDLRYFLALARAGTLTRAAQKLGVSHSTVARRVEALSEQAGVLLFTRTPEGYVLTAAGEELRLVVVRLEEEVAAATRVLASRNGLMAGQLKLTTIDVLIDMYGHHLASFRRRYPDIELSVSVDNAVVSLTRREADIALRLTNTPPGHLVGRRVTRYAWAPFASEKLLDEFGRDKHWSTYPWIGWARESRASMIAHWLEENIAQPPVASVDAALSMKALAQAGVGAAVMPTVMGQHGGLVQLADAIPGFEVDMWLLTHPDLRHTARVKALMEHLTQAIRGEHGGPP